MDAVSVLSNSRYMLRDEVPSEKHAEAEISISPLRDTETTTMIFTGKESGNGQ
jgi:hypothetical protein